MIDAVDRTLIGLLMKDARASNRALARAAGLAESTCLSRVAALERRGIITGYHASVNLERVNRGVEAFVQIKIRPQALGTVSAFCDELAELPEVLRVFLVTGASDIQALLAVASPHELRDFVLSLAQRDEIADIRSSIVYLSRQSPQVYIPA
ncbi:Lrp/AsnC family transcriptional regulator [Curtobacterium sp. PhB136]|uniref:Lrp/AsnC family transcriptional regulator n=1 Tax=Curtobacterium sp. PhB136 TaxID=2485181 RepID=UPI001048724B|nr:Lrp/AsnC family transcriptional regulator [Curtobacterium sp. PhB136]TCK65799.1 AsnC family transcriptional regulator [Curtobacterium sp. PhB136]